MDGNQISPFLFRCQHIGAHVIGQRFYTLLDQIPSLHEQLATTDVERVHSMVREAIELFFDASKRFRQDPNQYDHLVTWREEQTSHGLGRPSVREALFEEFIGFSEEYVPSLWRLIDIHRQADNQAKVAELESALTQLYSIGSTLQTVR